MEWPDPELGPNSCGMCCVLFTTSLPSNINKSLQSRNPPPPTTTTTTTTLSPSIHVLINIYHPESGSAITYITGYYIYISTGQVRGFHHQTASYGEITWCHLSHLEHTSTKPHNIPSYPITFNFPLVFTTTTTNTIYLSNRITAYIYSPLLFHLASSKVAAYCQKSGNSTCPLSILLGAAGRSALGTTSSDSAPTATPRRERWRRKPAVDRMAATLLEEAPEGSNRRCKQLR